MMFISSEAVLLFLFYLWKLTECVQYDVICGFLFRYPEGDACGGERVEQCNSQEASPKRDHGIDQRGGNILRKLESFLL